MRCEKWCLCICAYVLAEKFIYDWDEVVIPICDWPHVLLEHHVIDFTRFCRIKKRLYTTESAIMRNLNWDLLPIYNKVYKGIIVDDAIECGKRKRD